MFIEQLVVEGFKSYKERVVVQFNPGLNVVVGKNGAGKSNIFSAIEFVLSNKYSSLRAEDRQRLLHEGSGSGISQQLAAEVELTFDNK
jgi:structural maintenance of chromosome 3 (chondroitin sulfate proteoglycan 6)